MARDRQERGWRLTKAAWRLVRRDPTLVPLTLLALGACALALVAPIAILNGLDGHDGGRGARILLVVFGGSYAAAFVLSFLCAAIAHAASSSFEGEPLTMREAIDEARLALGTIATWALIAAGVAILIQLLRFSGGAGKPLGLLISLMWGFFTAYAVPIIALGGLSSGEAFSESKAIARRRWGEQLSGGIAIFGLGFLAALLGWIVCAIGLGAVDDGQRALGGGLLVAGVLGLTFVVVLGVATLQTFVVALFRFDGEELTLAELESPPPASPIGGSAVLRVGGIVVGLLVMATLIGALLPKHRDNDLGRYTPENGYYYTSFRPGTEVPLPAGAPVLLGRRQVGEVLGSRFERSRVVVWFRSDPDLEETIEDNPKRVFSLGGYYYLRVGPPDAGEALTSPEI
ncbi:MAG TPA: DUF6159 family protein [Solirubrobacterales bacterium]|nr:DUF6159 family protein [Solirubrobacterales bacterium]